MRRRTDGARNRRFCDELTVPAIEFERTGLRALSLQSLAGRQRANRAWRAERRRHQGTRRTIPTCFPGHQDEYFDRWIPKPFDPSMSSRDRCELRWRYGLARLDS